MDKTDELIAKIKNEFPGDDWLVRHYNVSPQVIIVLLYDLINSQDEKNPDLTRIMVGIRKKETSKWRLLSKAASEDIGKRWLGLRFDIQRLIDAL